MMNTPSYYCYTASGQKFCFSDPDLSQIRAEDIAHQLAQSNRWGGCCSEPFSVAQHSCVMSEMFKNPIEKKIALLHDAAEAYLVDIPSPLKALLPEYCKFEEIAWLAICKRFKLPEGPIPAKIKEADTLMKAWEAEIFMPEECYREHYIHLPSCPEDIGRLLLPAWHWKTARSTFLSQCHALFG